MGTIFLGFLTGGSLILVIGPQNIFVIEQGLKKRNVLIVTTICAFSDVLLIFIGIFIYHYLDFLSLKVEITLNIILLLFLIRFVVYKFREVNKRHWIKNLAKSQNRSNIILKTLSFTYLNPHVYSDTILILGNLTKDFILKEKIYFATGASIASIIFFYSIGYMSAFFANFITRKNTWRYLNSLIIIFMSCIIISIIADTYSKASKVL